VWHTNNSNPIETNMPTVKRDYQTLRPGILVALKTSVFGGVKFDRKDIAKTDDRTVEKWETTRLCDDPDDYDRAVGSRAAAGSEIRRVCSQTSFGLLCPESKEAELTEAIDRAMRIAAAHNQLSTRTKVRLYVVKGRVATDDQQAAEAIASDVGDMLGQMNDAVAKMDPDAIRKAAVNAKQMLQVLSEDKAKAASTAIEAARKVARTIVKRITNGGEDAAKVMADLQKEQGAIASARLSFIDVDHREDVDATPSEALPAVNLQRMADVETGPEEMPGPENDAEPAPVVATPVAIVVEGRSFLVNPPSAIDSEPLTPAPVALPQIDFPTDAEQTA